MKRQLNPDRISLIRSKIFDIWPLEGHEKNEAKSWQECVTAIDEANRRLVRQKKL